MVWKIAWICVRMCATPLPFITDPACARVITCSFTEPFVRTAYDSDRRTLVADFDAEHRREVLEDISLRTISETVFELRDGRGDLLQRIERSLRGSDGMSDEIYPYEVQWTPGGGGLPARLYGGCKDGAPANTGP